MRAILTFHSIDASASVLSFDVRLFEFLLAELARKAIPVCDLGTLLADDTKKGLAITFDDGMKSVFQNALPLLREYQVPAHLFVSSGVINGDCAPPPWPANSPTFEMLDWQEVEALQLAGVRVESHTHTHPDLRSLAANQVVEECERADEIISSRMGKKPDYFAYPFGYHNARLREIVRGRYCACVTTELRKLGVTEDTAALPRLDSYYLRSRAHIRLIDSPLMQLNLMLRNRMRNLKGSQCVADQD